MTWMHAQHSTHSSKRRSKRGCEMKKKLQEALNCYYHSKPEFTQYYKGMDQIVCSPLFVEQLNEIQSSLNTAQEGSAKSFKLYLDAVIMNMKTKIEKYKSSEYFEDQRVKEIDTQGYLIPFYVDDEDEKNYVLLGIFWKNVLSGNTTITR